MRRKESKPFQNHAARLLAELFTSRNLPVSLAAGMFLVFLHWFAMASHQLLAKGKAEAWWMLAPFPVMWLVLIGMARGAAGGQLQVREVRPPEARKALILFLSPPTGGRETAAEALQALEGIAGELPEAGLVKQFGASRWRMPMIAIGFHLKALEKVVVVPSKDTPGQSNGTWRYFPDFKKLVKRLTAGRAELEVQSLTNMGVEWAEGVDFEDAISLVAALNAVFDSLHEQGVADAEIMVDITSGQKMNSVMGAAVALEAARCFEYVSAVDYELSVYDVTHSSEWSRGKG